MGLARFYRGCTQVLYIGENSKRHFQRFGLPESKMVFSPYCVDTQVFQLHEASRQVLRQQVRRDLNIADNQVVLIFSGKLSYRKGVDLILAAIQRLPLETQAKVVVLFLGSGELQPQLTHQAQAMVNTEVHFLGFQNQTALSPYYHGADLLILPSRYSETWGLVVNEALHHGLPCLVSDAVGCAPDLIKPGQTGNLFRAGSIEHLAEKLDQSLPLAHNPQVHHHCKQLVSHYSVDKAAEGIAQAYRLI
jgi:glycosyltransferase involved in cell wall biosynthesis